MATSVSATVLARNLRAILNEVEFGRKTVTVVRNKAPIARIVPGTIERNALEVMSDLFGILSPRAAKGWGQQQGRGTLQTLRNPWDT